MVHLSFTDNKIYCLKYQEIVGTVWLTGNNASDERISFETFGAAANGIVVDNLALCSNTTTAWTRVLALLITACLITRAVGTNATLGSTRGWSS